ncbi:copper transporter [Jatrophihabitans endophyticus]|uniref:copper transporter n=1 Tax=Jatrophihabitans endophyticus TaxID=1206085 RepID=UPI0019F2B775|nr:copper transporter [Jatrophihabitans endophyticus]MBE7186770.1 copper transporter [Jatrophihabitans endophyticus]
MISFRYHLVSIVGIFLALALGIVVGTTALNGPITKDLRNQLDNARNQRDALSGQVKTLQGQVSDANKFASTYGARLVSDTLSKQSVLVVSMPGAGGLVGGITKQLTNAGATVAGRVTIESPYVTNGNSAGIVSLATGSARPIGWNAPQTSDAAQLGGSLLAYVLLGKGEKSDLSQVLGAFSELHMVSADSSVTSATDVVVVGTGTQKTYADTAEMSLVSFLQSGGGHVLVAGNTASAQKGGLVAAVRSSDAVRGGVSSVDDADSSFGQVSSALALANAVHGQTGHYGTQNGADALFPTPAN